MSTDYLTYAITKIAATFVAKKYFSPFNTRVVLPFNPERGFKKKQPPSISLKDKQLTKL